MDDDAKKRARSSVRSFIEGGLSSVAKYRGWTVKRHAPYDHSATTDDGREIVHSGRLVELLDRIDEAEEGP